MASCIADKCGFLNLCTQVSPHQRDVMKRRIGPFAYEEKPALILEDVLEAMFADFDKKHPKCIKFSKWKDVLRKVAWNIKKVRAV